MHFNENSKRPQRVSANNTAQYTLKFPKYKRGGHIVRPVAVKATYGKQYVCSQHYAFILFIVICTYCNNLFNFYIHLPRIIKLLNALGQKFCDINFMRISLMFCPPSIDLDSKYYGK